MLMVLYIMQTVFLFAWRNSPFRYIQAWASALLIYSRGQCEDLVHKISNEFRFPRFFYVLFLFRLYSSREIKKEVDIKGVVLDLK